MSGFEFTPAGIKTLGGDPVATPEIAAGTANVPGPEKAPELPSKKASEPNAPLNVMKRRDWLKELGARLKQVRRELKALRALEDEELELNRLIAAAKAAPGTVRNINSARKSS